MKNVVIAGFYRSPFTPAHNGRLNKVRPDDLVAQVVKGLIAKTGVVPTNQCSCNFQSFFSLVQVPAF